MPVLSDLWNGRYSLGKTFWLYGVLGSIVLCIAFMMIFWIPVINILVACVMIGYGIVWIVGTWRSSNHYQGEQIWAKLAKIFVAILAAIFVVPICAFGLLQLLQCDSGCNSNSVSADVDQETKHNNCNSSAPLHPTEKQIASARQVNAYTVHALDASGRCILQRDGVLRGYTADTITVKEWRGNTVHVYDVNGNHLSQFVEH